jgi:hypothetical protein
MFKPSWGQFCKRCYNNSQNVAGALDFFYRLYLSLLWFNFFASMKQMREFFFFGFNESVTGLRSYEIDN